MPDGKSLVAGVKKDVVVFDLLTLTPRVFGSHNQDVRGVTVSPNGRWIATTSEGDGIKIWDTAKATLVETIPHDNSFYAVQFTPSGKQLAAGCGNFKLRIWNLNDGK